MKRNKLLLILVTCLMLNVHISCYKQNVYSNFDEIEVIVVNKTPRGAYSDKKTLINYKVGWYEIGLSRDGKKPIEYIWRVGEDPYSYIIMNAKIGDKGIIHLRDWAKYEKIKLPPPNKKRPPIIGVFEEIYWVRQK